MKLEIGKRFMNRAGAKLRVIERIDSGHKYLDEKTHKHTTRPIYLFVCVIERFANGVTPGPDDSPCRVCVHEDGHWHPSEDHPLDLIAEVCAIAEAA